MHIGEQILRAYGEAPRGSRRRTWGVVALALLGLCAVGLSVGYVSRTRLPPARQASPAGPLLSGPGRDGGSGEVVRPADYEQHVKGRLTVKGEGSAAQDVEARPGETVRQTVEGDVVIDGKKSSGQRVRVRQGGSK